MISCDFGVYSCLHTAAAFVSHECGMVCSVASVSVCVSVCPEYVAQVSVSRSLGQGHYSKKHVCPVWAVILEFAPPIHALVLDYVCVINICIIINALTYKLHL